MEACLHTEAVSLPPPALPPFLFLAFILFYFICNSLPQTSLSGQIIGRDGQKKEKGSDDRIGDSNQKRVEHRHVPPIRSKDSKSRLFQATSSVSFPVKHLDALPASCSRHLYHHPRPIAIIPTSLVLLESSSRAHCLGA